MKLFEVQERIALRGGGIFTPKEFALFMGLSGTAAQKTLERYADKGVFIRLRNNYYMLKSRPAHPFSISNRIYQPSYVSFESALSYHCIIPETVYGITAATTKTTRHFTAENKSYTYYKIKKEAYTGYEPIKIGSETVYVASPEKALVDHLYMVNLGRAALHERLDVRKINRKKALSYASLFNRPNLSKLVKHILKEGDTQ